MQRNKLLKLLEKACVGCEHTIVDVWRNKLSCNVGFERKLTSPEKLCKKFQYSIYRLKTIDKILEENPDLKKDKEVIELAKKNKLNIKRKLYKEF